MVAPGAVIGKVYQTRYGPRRLIGWPEVDINRHLVDVDVAVALLIGGGEVLCRPVVAACLFAWLKELRKLTATAAAAAGVKPVYGVIYLSSAWRQLGETAGSGALRDPCGALDSNDVIAGPNGDVWVGHGAGYAVDCPTRFTRESFFPIPSVAATRVAANAAGLYQPFPKSDFVHWRPKKSAILADMGVA